MAWPDELIHDRGQLLPGAQSGQLERVETHFGVKFPRDYVEFLMWADGGVLPGGRILLYSVGTGLHPAETIFAANEGRSAHLPLLLIGRDAFEELGFLSADVSGIEERPATCPVYLYLHETEAIQPIAGSFMCFVEAAITKHKNECQGP